MGAEGGRKGCRGGGEEQIERQIIEDVGRKEKIVRLGKVCIT